MTLLSTTGLKRGIVKVVVMEKSRIDRTGNYLLSEEVYYCLLVVKQTNKQTNKNQVTTVYPNASVNLAVWCLKLNVCKHVRNDACWLGDVEQVSFLPCSPS